MSRYECRAQVGKASWSCCRRRGKASRGIPFESSKNEVALVS